MKRLIVIIAWLFVIPTLASAQSVYSPPRGLGYGSVGAGTKGMTPTAALGGEVYISKGLAVGAEVGATAITEQKMFGVGSADLSYHFFSKKNRGSVAPFAAGGYTLFFGHNTSAGKDVTTNGFNVGGGLDLFTTKRLGVRLDVRYYGHGGRILSRYSFPNIDLLSFVAFRIGMTFR